MIPCLTRGSWFFRANELKWACLQTWAQPLEVLMTSRLSSSPDRSFIMWDVCGLFLESQALWLHLEIALHTMDLGQFGSVLQTGGGGQKSAPSEFPTDNACAPSP